MAEDDDADAGAVERWTATVDGVEHRVELRFGSWKQHIRWLIDGEEVATKSTSDDRTTLSTDGDGYTLRVHKARWSDSARRVRVFEGEGPGPVAQALSGVGGTDLEPAAGTRAARRQQRMLEHPTRYTVQRAAGALAGILLPLGAIWLLGQLLSLLPKPNIDLPDAPDLPDLNLPSISLPSIDLPTIIDLPDLPAWVEQAAAAAGFISPVIIALVVARLEVRRRQRRAAERDAPS